MTPISELVTNFATLERPAGNLLDTQDLTAQCLAAVKFYAGYANLEMHLAIPIAEPAPIPPTPYPVITDATELSLSEWAIIRILFMLYVERENALQLEASRGMGVDVYGRASSEVAGDINQYELALPHMAFFQPIITV